jgi:hypothetical protein
MDDIARSLGRLEGKVDTLLDLATEDRARLSAVEKRVWWTGGVWAVLAIVGAKFGIPPFPQ